MKVWRNAEGREFPQHEYCPGAMAGGEYVSSFSLEALGYELVEKEPAVFELEARRGDYIGHQGGFLSDANLIPGKKYKVTECEE